MKIDVVPRSFFEKRIGQDDVLRILDTHKIISIQSSSGYDSLPPFSPDTLLSKNLLCLVFDDYFGIPDNPRELERIAVFTPEMADRIMRFVDDGAMPLIVHCTQGVSRSGAIGHVLDRWFNDIVVRNEADRVYFKSLIAGLIATKTPEEVRFLVFDPKCVEYTGLADLPHLLMPPVTSVQKMVQIVRWLESEVDKRLRMFASARCRNIAEFNSRKHIGDNADELPKTVPYIVAVFDELSDLMWKAGKEIEPLVCRMTAIARTAGVHLVIATGRPDAKVITGAIKVNLRGRIAFLTASSIDSMTIIDDKGAEKLLGSGDFMLRTGLTEIVRGQGAYVSDAEMSELVSAAVEKYGSPKYAEDEK